MGSVKKKLTKTLRKITPKEIAPILPFVAMAVPGLQGLSPLLRFGLPQLLTAAGSARTSGKINPLNQALAAFASYAAAPGKAGQLTGKEKAFMRSEGLGTDFAKMTPEQLRSSTAFSDAVKASDVESLTKGKDFLTGITRAVGDPIRGIGQGEFNLKNIGTVAALGGTTAGIDAAKKYQKEQEELAAYEAGLFDDYDQAVKDYIASFTGMQSNPGMLYGLPNLFAAEGGRVAAQEGGIMATAPGMPPGMQVDGRRGTFIPMGVKEKADDVPAMLSKNEFVMTADAVKAAGGGSVNKGAQRMYDLMNSLEAMV
jgi:hypothetical protein